MGITISNDGSNNVGTGLQTADNGLTVTGNEVQLGGVLVQATQINTGAFEFDIGDPTHVNGVIRVLPGAVQTLIENNTYKLSILAETASGGNLFFIATLGGQIIGLNVSTGFIKLVDGVNQVGAVYAADYSANGSVNPLWIPNLGFIETMLTGYAGLLEKFKQSGITATVILFTFTFAADAVITVNWSVIMTAFTSGNNVLAFSYTNKNGVVTALLGHTSTTVSSSAGSPAVIWVKGGTNFVATSTVTGVNSSDIAVSLVQIG